MNLMKRWSTTVRKKSRVPTLGFMGNLATGDRDKEPMTVWEFLILREYCMMDCHEDVMRPTFLSLWQTDAIFFVFPCFSGQRGIIAL